MLARLRLPETQVEIAVGGRTFRVDAIWRDINLIVEIDGYATHATRSELARDAERTALLQSLGFEVLRFTHRQILDDPMFVVAQVGLRLARAAV